MEGSDLGTSGPDSKQQLIIRPAQKPKIKWRTGLIGAGILGIAIYAGIYAGTQFNGCEDRVYDAFHRFASKPAESQTVPQTPDAGKQVEEDRITLTQCNRTVSHDVVNRYFLSLKDKINGVYNRAVGDKYIEGNVTFFGRANCGRIEEVEITTNIQNQKLMRGLEKIVKGIKDFPENGCFKVSFVY